MRAFLMNPVWIAALGVVGITVIGLGLRWLFMSKPQEMSDLDLGSISEKWLAEQKGMRKDQS